MIADRRTAYAIAAIGIYILHPIHMQSLENTNKRRDSIDITHLYNGTAVQRRA